MIYYVFRVGFGKKRSYKPMKSKGDGLFVLSGVENNRYSLLLSELVLEYDLGVISMLKLF